MSAAKKLKKEERRQLRVIKGGNNGEAKAPPKPAKKGDSTKRDPKRPWRKPGVWTSVLRLPEKLAGKLKRAADKNEVSINTLLETLITTYVKSERIK